MANIGILGGTFDPIHNGHLAIARAALEQGMDRVIFIPSGTPPHKTAPFAGKHHRLQMAILATKDEPRFSVCDFEVNRTETSYSVDTLRWLHTKYPNDTLYFLLGDDAYYLVEYWKDSSTIQKLCRFLVFSREKVDVLPPAKAIRIPVIPISSTDIRKKAMQGEPFQSELPASVYEYIQTHRLYQKEQP